jgi:hypothetical protein
MRLAYRRLPVCPSAPSPHCAAIPGESTRPQPSCCKFDKSHSTQPIAVAIDPTRVIISAFA